MQRFSRQLAAAAMAIGCAGPALAQDSDFATSFEALSAQASANETGLVRVLVRLKVDYSPEALLPSSNAVATQRASIESAQSQLLDAIAEADPTLAEPIEGLPYAVVEVDQAGLESLEASGQVLSVEEDVIEEAFLQDSVPLIEAPSAWSAGYTGQGQTIAILDTGVDTSHGAFAGRITAEACFSSTSQANNSVSVCPNGQGSQTGAGAGVNCSTSIRGCDHGTHVAGIAAGKSPNLRGVAPDAKIIAIQVFSRFNNPANCRGRAPCVLTYRSDQIRALQHVSSLAGRFDIAAVNMSLGGGKSTTACDGDPRKPVIDQLRNLGIATAIASGNDGFKDGVSLPGCISSAVTVGSTTKADKISVFSNSAQMVDLLAPGGSIRAAVPGGGFGVKSGTSMATPHVAGAFAVLAEKTPSASVTAIENELKTKGKPITDTRNNITKPRINLKQTPKTGLGRLAYAWANNPTSANYTPSATYAYNSSGGAITIMRSGTGRYAVRFAGLGGNGTAGGHVQVTGYGNDSHDCKVRSWASGGTDFVANVNCYNSSGALVNARYTVLAIWQ